MERAVDLNHQGMLSEGRHGDHGHRGDTVTSTNEAETVGCRGLHRDTFSSDSECVGEVVPYHVPRFRNPNVFGNHRCIHVGGTKPLGHRHGRRLTQKEHRIGVLEQWVVGWEVLTDISQHTRPEQRIGDGVGKHIAVGGGSDSVGFGDGDPSKSQRRLIIESVGVVTPADTCDRGSLTHSSTGSTLGRARSSFLMASSSSI